jgi:hypothetical protein
MADLEDQVKNISLNDRKKNCKDLKDNPGGPTSVRRIFIKRKCREGKPSVKYNNIF